MTDEPTTLAALIEAQAETLGDKPFLRFEDRVISFAVLNRQVNRAANGLAALGVKTGVGVSIMMPNSPEWLFVYFATQKLGAVAVPVNVGLKGEGLRRRGENISPWEVECEIDRHAAVLESAVFGVPSDLGEDEVMAVVVLKEGQTLAPEDLIAHCEAQMAGFMVPRYVEFRDALPKTGTQRIQKSILKQEGVGPTSWDREAHRDGAPQLGMPGSSP